MGPHHGVDRCRVGDTVFNRTTVGVAAPVDVLGAVAGGQATEPEPDIRLETRVGDLHVGEQGVTAAAFGQHLVLEPGGRQGLLGAQDRRDRRDLQLGHRACSSAHRSVSVPRQGPTCRIPAPEG